MQSMMDWATWQLTKKTPAKSNTLNDRADRLKYVKKNAASCQRDLKRDRTNLDRAEKSLMIQLKSFASKGDLPKAKMIAQQIALYRSVSDKNFSRSVVIGSQAQLMFSNNRIHQAQIESIKGISNADIGHIDDALLSKSKRYIELANHYADMEDILLENMDEIYETFGSEKSNSACNNSLELETNAILRQALDPTLKSKYYINRASMDPIDKEEVIFIHLRIHSSSNLDKEKGQFKKSDGATIMIPTLDMSVDMLKRQISQDFFAIKQLQIGQTQSKPAFDAALGNVQPFKLGKLVTFETDDGKQKQRFQAFDFTESLQSLEIENGDTIWIKVLQE